jgi:hypothetical protein
MERKINQGSTQAQGEAPELLLEEALKKNSYSIKLVSWKGPKEQILLISF